MESMAQTTNAHETMKAAVVQKLGHLPEYSTFQRPNPAQDEVLLAVKAAALTQLVKSQAAGTHYSSHGILPFIPGTDGVGTLEDGTRVYFAFPRDPYGSMAELTTVSSSYYFPLPSELDDVTAAALANPGMSSWAALTMRANFQAGETVLINGATGTAGKLAIQIAKYLGAARVIATGRRKTALEPLTALGADEIIDLEQAPDALDKTFRRVLKEDGADIVLDYLWGPSAERLLSAATGHAGGGASSRLRYVQIGSVAGPTVALQASALRSSGLELMGSGLGSVSNLDLLKAISGVMNAAAQGKLTLESEAVPLSEVAGAWENASQNRIVFTM